MTSTGPKRRSPLLIFLGFLVSFVYFPALILDHGGDATLFVASLRAVVYFGIALPTAEALTLPSALPRRHGQIARGNHFGSASAAGLPQGKLQTHHLLATKSGDDNDYDGRTEGGVIGPIDETTKLGVTEPKPEYRMVPYDFGFTRTYSHNVNTLIFLRELENTVRWHCNKAIRNQMLSPILVIAQSSGTGKTRLMHEAKTLLMNGNTKWTNIKGPVASRTILLTAQTDQEDSLGAKLADASKMFDLKYPVPTAMSQADLGTLRDKFREMVYEQCKKAVEEMKGVLKADKEFHVVLFFDEAQHLAIKDEFLIQVLHWITLEMPSKRPDELSECRITAVLASTTISLMNFSPEKKEKPRSSRFLEPNWGYYEEGTIRSDPFHIILTMGCLKDNEDLHDTNWSEYQNMIRFSRPLFPIMYKEGRLNDDAMLTIATKVCLGDWSFGAESSLAVLATRIQMGQASMEVVSKLVSKGYAHLTYFEQASEENGMVNKALFAYMPDPVCARISMAMMDDEYVFRGKIGGNIAQSIRPKGLDKSKWSSKLGQLFSTGLCQADEGDFGEVAAALHLLYSGDELRKTFEDDYSTFSVNLWDWLRNLKKFGVKDGTVDDDFGNDITFKGSVNFIQFYRFEAHGFKFADETFHRILYEKGCAVYCPNSMPGIDMILPCKMENGDYIPVFVSVKNIAKFGPAAADAALVNAINAVYRDRKDTDKANGLVLVCSLGQDELSDGYRNVLGIKESDDLKCVQELKSSKNSEKPLMDIDAMDHLSSDINDIHRKIVPKIFHIHEDKFGIHAAIVASSKVKGKYDASKVYSMHGL